MRARNHAAHKMHLHEMEMIECQNKMDELKDLSSLIVDNGMLNSIKVLKVLDIICKRIDNYNDAQTIAIDKVERWCTIHADTYGIKPR